MYCKNCGTQLDDSAKFCKNCGTPTASPAQPAQSAQPEANQHARPEANQPARPAQPARSAQPAHPARPAQPTQPARPVQQPANAGQQPQTAAPKQDQPPKKKSRLPIIIAAACVAVAAVAAVVVLVVLPALKPKGIWLGTKTSYEQTTKDGKTTERSKTASVYETNEAGIPTQLTSTYIPHEGDDETRFTYTYEFDDDGHVIKQTDDGGVVTTYEWEKDAQGRATKVVETTNYEGGSTWEGITTYEYNSAGLICKEDYESTFTSRSTSSHYEYHYEFDDGGYLVRITNRDDDGTKTESTVTYEKNAEGVPLSATRKTTDKKTGKTTYESKTTYSLDEHGNPSHYEEEATNYDLEDGTKSTTTTQGDIEFVYVENPSEWTRQMQHLFLGSIRLT